DGTWYAHASVGLLHVRPVLNLRQDLGVAKMRAIAEEAFDLVAAYKGSHSGEHGDGIVRSEFHERMFGSRMVRSFEQVKDRFDPDAILNPGKIVRAPKMDERSLLRWPVDYRQENPETVFDWSQWPGGLIGATEMCNNNGACRKAVGGVMCPSYRVTRNERDVTRGRANSLRLALTGRLGKKALFSPEMADTMHLCVSCKACKSECPMSVDMAKMKIEIQHARIARQGLSLRDRVIANLPRYAPLAARIPFLSNLPRAFPKLLEQGLGLSAKRKTPKFVKPFNQTGSGEVLIFADTFNRHFEPETLYATMRVIERCGYSVGVVQSPNGNICCGRTFLSAGLTEQAKSRMSTAADAFGEALNAGKIIVGLEPSCVLTFRDEAVNLLSDWTEEMGQRILTFGEFMRTVQPGNLHSIGDKALVHGHCHQKAFGCADATMETLGFIPGLVPDMIESSCCGMAGQFGYQKETEDVSQQMAELSLAPTIRKAAEDTLLVADGFSCRCQIKETTNRNAMHSAVALDRAMSKS
ncbi:MAG: FAD-linked oxidase C-terminal domain-containing protein, partial [Rhizobiaceae bacterium]